MSFLIADISYTARKTTIYHRSSAICKDPWLVHSVPCPKHVDEILNTNVWTFSEYKDWNSTGKSATLTVSELKTTDPKDKELLDLFNQGNVQIKIRVQFTGLSRVYDLSLDLKP